LTPLFGKTYTEIQDIVTNLNIPAYSAKQITEWLYKHNIKSIDEMTNISLKNREILKSEFEIGLVSPENFEISNDGTKKYLFNVKDNKFVEAVYIPENDRSTLCVSSQVGCKMGCLFCLTGYQGFHGHLTAGEIINQIHSLPEFNTLTNIVYMGMGEPFDNIEEVLKSLEIITSDYGYAWSPKRITVSSIGVIPGLQKFLNVSKCHLAISLHNPFDDERALLMPKHRNFPISEILSVIKSFDFGLQRRVSFEYIMFKNLNDTYKHAKELIRILDGINCRINLIKFHKIPDSSLEGSNESTIKSFQEMLNQRGIVTTIRASRGQDISAACGMLYTKMKKNQPDDQ
jgi:23S rRNA (adenine2503-C2)-methyltransferase